MPLSSGTNTSTFEDRLRALGALLDRRDLYGIALELDRHGLTLAARRGPVETPETIVLRLSAEQVATLCRDARRRRGAGGTPGRHQRPSRLATLRAREMASGPLSQWLEQTWRPPYQELLRVIGRDLDGWQARSCRIEEGDGAYVVRVLSAGTQGGVQQIYRLDKEILRARVAAAIRQRKYQQPAKGAGGDKLTAQA